MGKKVELDLTWLDPRKVPHSKIPCSSNSNSMLPILFWKYTNKYRPILQLYRLLRCGGTKWGILALCIHDGSSYPIIWSINRHFRAGDQMSVCQSKCSSDYRYDTLPVTKRGDVMFCNIVLYSLLSKHRTVFVQNKLWLMTGWPVFLFSFIFDFLIANSCLNRPKQGI